MIETILVLLIIAGLIFVPFALFGSIFDSIQESSDDCPLCFASIPAGSETCPHCKTKL